MAAPTLTLINAGAGTLTDGFVGTDADAENISGWNDFGTLDPDIKVEGSNSMSGIGRANNEDMYYTSGGADITAVGKVFRGWFNTVNIAYMGTIGGANPYEMFISDGTNDARKPLLGSDTYEGGWLYVVQDMDLVSTGDGWSDSPTLANVDEWGWTTGHDSNAKNVINCWADAFRYMDGYYLTGGTTGDKVDIGDLFTADMGGASPKAYGIVQQSRGIYFGTGTIQVGNGATTTYFEMVGEVLQFVDMVGELEITAGLYEISAEGSGCDCTVTGSVIRGGPAGDATTRVYFDFSDTNHTLAFTNNLIVKGGTVTFASGQACTGNTFDDCGQVLANGADLSNGTIKNYEGTADTAALVWDTASSPDGKLDDMSFVKGTAATHAIEFTTAASTSLTLRDIDFSGYSTSTSPANDSTFYVTSTSTGDTYTINLNGVTGPVSYKSLGAEVIVEQTVSYKISVNPATSGIEVVVVSTDEATVYYRSTTTSTGTVSYSYNYTGDVNRKVQIVSVPYDNQTISVVLGSVDGTLPVSLSEDSVYFNP